MFFNAASAASARCSWTKPECRVEQHHDGDDDCVLEIPHHAGQHGGTDQHYDEEIPELIEELAPCCARRLLGEAVGAVPGQPLRGLHIGEPLPGVTAQLVGDLPGGQRVPGRGRVLQRSLEAAHR